MSRQMQFMIWVLNPPPQIAPFGSDSGSILAR